MKSIKEFITEAKGDNAKYAYFDEKNSIVYLIAGSGDASPIEVLLKQTEFSSKLEYFYTDKSIKNINNGAGYFISGFWFEDNEVASQFYNDYIETGENQSDDWEWDCDGVCYSINNVTSFIITSGINSGIKLKLDDIINIISNATKFQ